MKIEEELIDQFVNQASNLHGLSLVTLIVDATSHPSLYSFSEILSVPNVIQLQGTEHSVYLDLLRMFAHGTWTEYKSNASNLPPLVPEQILKLKQLTLLTLAETNKVLPYDVLMYELDVVNVRELDDFLTGIIRGKLDQFRICFQVQFAAGRDLMPGKLESICTLSNWSSTSDNMPTEPYMIYLRIPSLSSEHPWVVLQNPKDAEEVSSDDQIFYAMGPFIKNNLPRFHCRLHQLSHKHIQGFFHGWMVLCYPPRTCWFLWNTATSTEINLPTFSLTDSIDFVDCFKHCCLSSTPDDPSSVFLLARSDRTNLLICQLDNRKWTEVSYRDEIDNITLDSSGILHNLTCFEGKIFALCSDALLGTGVVLVEIISKDRGLTIILNHYVYGPTFSRHIRSPEEFLKGTNNGLYYIVLKEDTMHGLSYACLYKLETGAMIWERIHDLKDAIFYVDLGRSASVFYSVVTDSESSGYIHSNTGLNCMCSVNVKKCISLLWRGPHTQKTNVYSLWECSSPPPIEEMVNPSFSYQKRSIRLCEGRIIGFDEMPVERLDESFNIRGFFYDWVVLSSNANIRWSIWNQKTLNVINLPTLDLDVLDCEAIKQCCLSASPDDPSSVLLLMRADKPTFLVCHLDTNKWTEISYSAKLDVLTGIDTYMIHDITSRILHSITYSDGKLYVLNADKFPLLIEVETTVIHGEVALQLLLCGECPFPSHRNYMDFRYYLKGYGVHLFCIVVLFDNESKSTVREVVIYRVENVEHVKNLDMRYRNFWDNDMTMRWEEMRDFRGTFLVDLSRNYSVFYDPESGCRGQVELHHPAGRVVYKYSHQDQTICVSYVPDGTPTTCLSLWECRSTTNEDRA